MWIALLAIGIAATAELQPAVPKRIDLTGGGYWVLLPDPTEPHTRYPLIIAIHDTASNAQQTLHYWKSVVDGGRFIVVSPESATGQWRDTETEFIQEFRADLLESIPFDPTRVLMTGHATGGVLALYLLYEMNFDATAVAVTSAVLPPAIQSDSIARHKDVPLLCTMSPNDYPAKPFKESIQRLRDVGVRVTTKQLSGDQMLDIACGRTILDWFNVVCHNAVGQQLDRLARMTTRSGYPGPAAAELEQILRDQASHDAGQVARAAELLARLQSEGGKMLEEARSYLDLGQAETAVKIFLEVERQYQPSSLADEARAQRLQIQTAEKQSPDEPTN